MFTHSCIKCQTKYESEEDDAYYCASCLEATKAIAAEVDKQFANRPKREPVSDFQILLEKGQSKGQATFVRAADLGISF